MSRRPSACAAPGWDMDNKQGLSETFKQVIHEESIKDFVSDLYCSVCQCESAPTTR